MIALQIKTSETSSPCKKEFDELSNQLESIAAGSGHFYAVDARRFKHALQLIHAKMQDLLRTQQAEFEKERHELRAAAAKTSR